MVFFVILFIIVGAGLLIYSSYIFDHEEDDFEPKKLNQKYSQNMSPTAAVSQTEKSQARTSLLTQLEQEVDAIYRMNSKEANAVLEEMRRGSDMASYESETKLKQMALAEGLDVATYLEISRASRMAAVQVRLESDMMMAQIRGGLIYQERHQQQLALQTEYLCNLYERAKAFEMNGNDRARQLIERHIVFMEERFYEEQTRLLQNDNRSEEGGGDEDTYVG